MGVPKDADDSDDYLMDKGVYVVSYNPRLRDPNWVSWRLDGSDFGRASRQDNFRIDPELPATMYHVTTTDYAHSGFDRGHLCPSADRTRSVSENAATFLMTNMQPQRPELNRGPWEDLEEHERELARQHHEVFITAGGIFDAHPKTIGHGVAVPRAEFKIIVVLDAGQGVESVTDRTEVIAVVMPNEPSVQGKPWTTYLTNVDDVEHVTGYDFLTNVPQGVQNAIESRKATAP